MVGPRGDDGETWAGPRLAPAGRADCAGSRRRHRGADRDGGGGGVGPSRAARAGGRVVDDRGHRRAGLHRRWAGAGPAVPRVQREDRRPGHRRERAAPGRRRGPGHGPHAPRGVLGSPRAQPGRIRRGVPRRDRVRHGPRPAARDPRDPRHAPGRVRRGVRIARGSGLGHPHRRTGLRPAAGVVPQLPPARRPGRVRAPLRGPRPTPGPDRRLVARGRARPRPPGAVRVRPDERALRQDPSGRGPLRRSRAGRARAAHRHVPAPDRCHRRDRPRPLGVLRAAQPGVARHPHVARRGAGPEGRGVPAHVRPEHRVGHVHAGGSRRVRPGVLRPLGRRDRRLHRAPPGAPPGGRVGHRPARPAGDGRLRARLADHARAGGLGMVGVQLVPRYRLLPARRRGRRPSGHRPDLPALRRAPSPAPPPRRGGTRRPGRCG